MLVYEGMKYKKEIVMSDEKNEMTPTIDTRDNDWFLQSFVNLANYKALEFSITLNVGGFLISGNLIGGKKYFDKFAAEFSGAYEDKHEAEVIKNALSKHGEIYLSDEDEIPPPVFIHLEDARFFSTHGKPIPNNNGVLWRGQISKVDGFILGGLKNE
jgi:hypothetical protein